MQFLFNVKNHCVQNSEEFVKYNLSYHTEANSVYRETTMTGTYNYTTVGYRITYAISAHHH